MQTDSAQPAVSNDYPMGVLPPELGSSEEMASYLGPVDFNPADSKAPPSKTAPPNPIPPMTTQAVPGITASPQSSSAVQPPTPPPAQPSAPSPASSPEEPPLSPTLPEVAPKTVINTSAVPQVDALSPPALVQGPVEAKNPLPPPPPAMAPPSTMPGPASASPAPAESPAEASPAPNPPSPQNRAKPRRSTSLLLTLVFILGGLFSLGALGALALYFFTAQDPQMLASLTEMFSFLSHPASLIIPIALLLFGGVLLVIGVKAPEKS